MRQNRIKILCAQNDISIADLAKKIGMQPAALRRYTRHEAQPRIELAQQVAAALNVTPDEVLGIKIGSEKIEVARR